MKRGKIKMNNPNNNKAHKKIYIVVLILISIILLFSFLIKGKKNKIPFNGDVTLGNLSIQIPKDFIRDSKKSNNNQYVFEKNNYDIIIVLTKTNTNGYSLRNLVNSAPNENGKVIYYNNDYTKCDIEYIINSGIYSFTHSQIRNDIRYQIIVQSKNETNAKLVYDDLIQKAHFDY